jgi:hypothetical protein
LSSSKTSGEKIYRRKEEIVSRSIAGELFLVPISGNLADMQRIFTLSPVAEFIWNQLDGEKDLNAIQRDILSAFAVEREEADADLYEFISQLLEAQLIDETGKS